MKCRVKGKKRLLHFTWMLTGSFKIGLALLALCRTRTSAAEVIGRYLALSTDLTLTMK